MADSKRRFMGKPRSAPAEAFLLILFTESGPHNDGLSSGKPRGHLRSLQANDRYDGTTDDLTNIKVRIQQGCLIDCLYLYLTRIMNFHRTYSGVDTVTLEQNIHVIQNESHSCCGW